MKEKHLATDEWWPLRMGTPLNISYCLPWTSHLLFDLMGGTRSGVIFWYSAIHWGKLFRIEKNYIDVDEVILYVKRSFNAFSLLYNTHLYPSVKTGWKMFCTSPPGLKLNLVKDSNKIKMLLFSSHYLGIRWCGTHWSNLVMKSSASIRISNVVLCTEKLFANSSTVRCGILVTTVYKFSTETFDSRPKWA